MIKVIISGGGTGGHVYPAIAIANAIKKIRPDAQIHFVGAKGKLEMEKVPKAGYTIDGLWISGFQRKLTLRNLMFPFKLINSMLKARKIINRFKPDVVVGVGGYASGPVLEQATRMNIPSLIQEQNSYAGLTNKILSKKVDKICVAYNNMEKYFPKDKLVLTGNPVRKDILDLKEKYKESVSYFDMDQSKKTLLIFGGSLGARALNNAVRHNTSLINQNAHVQLIWQVGKLYYEEFSQCESAKLDNVKLLPFIERMDLAYAAADLVICRAGALTISELCLVGKAAILVPSPNVAEDHQTKNAMALVNVGAAEMMDERKGLETMMQKAYDLLNDTQKMEKIGQEIRKLAKPNASEQIANEVIELKK